jgi:hypothetical protein
VLVVEAAPSVFGAGAALSLFSLLSDVEVVELDDFSASMAFLREAEG